MFVFMIRFTADGPHKIEVVPYERLYSNGDKVMCYADGNPPSILTWSNVDTGEIRHNTELILKDYITKSASTWQCTAINPFTNKTLQINITVENDVWGTY